MYLCNENVLENYAFLVDMCYTHTGYQTSIFGKKTMHIIFKFLQYLIILFDAPGTEACALEQVCCLSV